MEKTPLDRLERRFGQNYPALSAAREKTRELVERLREAVPSEPPHTSFVVFGSLGRGEVTRGSDADWVLLVDGPASPSHFALAQTVEAALVQLSLKEPGRSGTFGALSSSHELIHHIGGVNDSNQNLTRRILLLIESAAIAGEAVHERVIEGVLDRYVVYGQAVPRREKHREAVPWFLLNDVVRYWRTMTVDYAAKRWEQPGGKWALRNAKLRMSRKLLFVAGLLMCFKFELDPPEDREEVLSDLVNFPKRLASFLVQQTRLQPLEMLADVVASRSNSETARLIFSSYDAFLACLDDSPRRERLEKLKFEDAADDELFREVQEMTRQFQKGLSRLFYEDDERLAQLVRKYGVF